MRCDQCRFWEVDVGTVDANRIGFRRCAAVRDFIETAHSVGRQDSRGITQVTDDQLRSARAFTQGEHEEPAWLCTAPDFFCALFQKRD